MEVGELNNYLNFVRKNIEELKTLIKALDETFSHGKHTCTRAFTSSDKQSSSMATHCAIPFPIVATTNRHNSPSRDNYSNYGHEQESTMSSD